jgi:GDP-fucose transporter C1
MAAARTPQATVAAVVATYWLVSISLVFVNKLLLTEGASIPAPLFVTWFQCLVTWAICAALGVAGRSAAPGSFLSQFPPVTYDLAIARKLLPLSLVFVGMVTFNNLALQYVEVSFYQVARSLTIVFNVAFTWYMLGETTSMRVIGTLAVVCIGFFAGSAGEVRFSWLGATFGILSSIFVALNGIYTKKTMAVVDGNQWRLSAYNNANAVVLFLPLLLVSGEMTVIRANYALLFSSYFWGIMLLGGVFGFAIGIVTIMQIKFTSPLTHNISGTAKSGAQTLLALWLWENPTTVANLSGVALVLIGSAAYTYVRTVEAEAEKTAKSRSPVVYAAVPVDEVDAEKGAERGGK